MKMIQKKLLQSPEILSVYRWIISTSASCSTYKNTILLPKTNFPHKVNSSNRRERDHMIENVANFEGLYSYQRSQNNEKHYILHDGPPYANGGVHIGHAVNKILKDITVRQKLLQGHKVHFVPGWDCHGLPIELKVLKDGNVQNRNLDLAVRKKAYEFSQKNKEQQLHSFKEWGILADWKNSYFTCHPNYIINQLQIFQDLYDQGIIYQDHKPVFWSPSNKTSLAEAELEYNPNHVSTSVYVKLVITNYPSSLKSILDHNSSLNALIWTTTPWSLPANQAICYSADKMYNIVFCKERNEYYVVAQEVVLSLAVTLKSELVPVHTFPGSDLSGFEYVHPILKNRKCSFFPANHVTMTKGTGLVHTAPNHGLDDYFVAKAQNLQLDACLVDDNGNFTSDAGEELAGKAVLSDGSKQIINILNKQIVFIEDYVHSYPYDWRSKTPVIIKSSHQWFLNVQKFQTQAMACLQSVKVYPDHLKKVFMNLLASAPQWCISRQRAWGVPIPAFYPSQSKVPVVNRILTNHLCKLIEKHGIHCWWEMEVKDLLPSSLIEKCGLENVTYEKGSDILDIWLDSGVSWKNVLPEPHVSDVCIEGIDQIRGWFNSSLMTSVALRGKAPYKSLVFHGFTTDADGRKMSKSEGNVISPFDIISGSKKSKIPVHGIDVLRWWVASHACHHENIAVKTQIIEECAQSINRLRNVFKFLLGSIHEFSTYEDIVEPHKMRPLDLHMLHLLKNFFKKVHKEYDCFQYKTVAKDIINFTTNDVSSFYCQLIKDRLYCDSKDSIERLSCQTVLYFVLNTLVQSIGAICPHLAEEVIMHHPIQEYAKQGLFRSTWPCLEKFLSNSSDPACISFASQVRQALMKADLKTLNLNATFLGSNKVIESLQNLNTKVQDDSGCTEFFQVSSVLFTNDVPQILPETAQVIKGQIQCTEGEIEPFTIILNETDLQKCPRCRKYSSVSSSTLCMRCLDIINKDSKISSKV